MRVGAVQLTSTGDKEANLAIAARLVAEGVERGAELLVLPEMFNCLGSGRVLRDGAEVLDGPTSAWAAETARLHGIHLVAGSFIERHDHGSRGSDAAPAGGHERNHNTSCTYGPDGRRTAVYRKIHLFDVDVPGAVFHESDVIAPGREIVVVDAGALRLGLNVCYDLRFPEPFRIQALRGATVATVPAAFTARTGPPHWEVLLRARAIENQVFVIAAGQRGTSSGALAWHGHSMIIDPWGTVLAEAPDEECVIVADLDLQEQQRIRTILPSVANRRPEAYRWPRDDRSATSISDISSPVAHPLPAPVGEDGVGT